MRVSEIMSKSVVTASVTTTIRDLWKALFTKNINALPVTDKSNRLVGIVTKEDLLSALYPDYQEYIEDFASASDFAEMEEKLADIASIKAGDIMNKRVIFTREDTMIMRALSRMIARRLNQLPVLTQDNKLVGMITKGDIFRALFRKQLGKLLPKKEKTTLKVVKGSRNNSRAK